MPGNIINLTPANFANFPKPNYVNPYTRGYMPAFALTWFCAGTIMVFLRLWLRVRGVAGKLGLDDLFLSLGWLVGLMFTITTVLVSNAHADRHTWDIHLADFETIALYVWLGELGYLLSSSFIRIAVMLFYRRLIDGIHSPKWSWAILGAIIYTAAWTLAFVLALFLNCRPFPAYWKAFSPTYKTEFTCANTTVINALSGVFAITGDLYAILLPFALTVKMQMPKRQKIALNSIFALGLFVVAASSVRTYFTVQVSVKADVSWAIFNVFVWSQVELQLALLCASAPTTRVFFRQYLSPTVSRATGALRNGASASGSGSGPRMGSGSGSKSGSRSITIVHQPNPGVQRHNFGGKMVAFSTVKEKDSYSPTIDDTSSLTGTRWSPPGTREASMEPKHLASPLEHVWSSPEEQPNEYELHELEKGPRVSPSQQSHRTEETWDDRDGATSSTSVL